MDNSMENGCISFCGNLTIAFIILRLCKVISWSWWWVLAPIWIAAVIGLVIVILVIVFHIDITGNYWW